MPGIRSRQTTVPYQWGGSCLGWRLSDTQGLQVTEEELPPGATEELHCHEKARQVYYLLSGSARVRLGEETIEMTAGEALEIPPGTPHLIANDSRETAALLVISSPSTRGDRLAVPSREED